MHRERRRLLSDHFWEDHSSQSAHITINVGTTHQEEERMALFISYNWSGHSDQGQAKSGSGWVVLTKYPPPESTNDIFKMIQIILKVRPQHKDVVPIYWTVLASDEISPMGDTTSW
jgi:hypothetical protein